MGDRARSPVEKISNHRISADDSLDATALRGPQQASALQASPERLKILPERIQPIRRDLYPERQPSELYEDISPPLTQTELRHTSLPATWTSLQSSPVFFEDEEFSPAPRTDTAQPGRQVSPHTPSLTLQRSNGHQVVNGGALFELTDSLDASDVPYSQERPVSSSCNSSADEVPLSDIELQTEINEAEVRALQPTTYLADVMEQTDSGATLCEDLFSRIYYDFDEERYSREHWADVDAEAMNLCVPVSAEELEERAQAQRSGGLDGWHYDSPFDEVFVKIDNVNRSLEGRFVEEANTALDRVVADISSRKDDQDGRDDAATLLTPLSCMQTFVTECLLEKLRYVANRVLHERKKAPTTKKEILGMLILHILCASYNESPTTVCDPLESGHFFQMGLSADRYYDVWGALSGSKEPRATHDYSSTGWSRTANRATTLITEIEAEVAAVNRDLLYVQNATVFSLDDDHLRMASRAVVELTYLRQHNNPKKGLGPVGNALCSALNPFFIACHFTRTGEKLLHTWERLIQMVQGASTTGALRPMPNAIFAADRGYNSKETISFLSDKLGASLLGTHKRDLWYPFVFGEGPISRRHRGMDVSERGCRAVYTAQLKGGGARSSQVRRAEACVYRESCSGRIAALVHNNASLFPSRCFTVVLRDSFRTKSSVQKLQESLVAFDEYQKCGDRPTRSESVRSGTVNHGKNKVEQLLSRCTMLTYYQSEDPVWFLLRAFRFTSRTAHGFKAALASDYEALLGGLSWLLREKVLTIGAQSLSEDHVIVREYLRPKWEQVLRTLGMALGCMPRPSSRASLADRISNSSASRISATTKPELLNFLSVFGRVVDSRANKPEVVAAVMQLKADILSRSVSTDGGNEADHTTDDEMAEQAAKRICILFREASLTSWVMKPLVPTAGMKEGTRNELEIIRAIPNFFAGHLGAYKRGLCSSTYSWDHYHSLTVNYIRTTGLLESQSCSMVADSPDAVMAATDGDNLTTVYAVEIKTMTAVRTIEGAVVLREKYGAIISLENVGTDDKSSELFRELVPSTQYRAQVLHHCATLGMNHVAFVVGTGGSMVEGNIIYTCLVEFSESLRHSYTYCLDCVRVSVFSWVGLDASLVPKEYDELLKDSHASDLYSFVSYYNLSKAIRKEVLKQGSPIPPCRMIRLTPAVFWNNLKGGVDVISRYLKTLARTNISENPVISIIARLLSMQICNAAVIYRLSLARQRNILPPSVNEQYGTEGYASLRHKVTRCDTFGSFARRLAQEWAEKIGSTRSQDNENGFNEYVTKLTPFFKRKASEQYNLGIHKARRLNKNLRHEKVHGTPTYCVLCSWVKRGTKDGKPKTKRKGSRQVQWCCTCRQAICSSCWIEWHSRPTLKRHIPTAADEREFDSAPRTPRRRANPSSSR